MTEIQTFWTGAPPGDMEHTSLASCIRHGYTVRLYTYNPLEQIRAAVPPEVIVCDARDILPEIRLFEYDGRGDNDAYRFLPFSDLFRFMMLHQRGGIWLDLDIFMLRPVAPEILNRPYVFSSERTIQVGAYAMRTPSIVDMGFIKVPGPGSALTSYILERLPKKISSPFAYMKLYRKAIAALELDEYVLPPKAFLPLNWWDVMRAHRVTPVFPALYGQPAFRTEELDDADCFGIHWFRAIVRKKKLIPTPGSLYDIVRQRILFG